MLASYESFRNKRKDELTSSKYGSLERRSMFEKRGSWSPEEQMPNLDNFKSATITVSSFFKQVCSKKYD